MPAISEVSSKIRRETIFCIDEAIRNWFGACHGHTAVIKVAPIVVLLSSFFNCLSQRSNVPLDAIEAYAEHPPFIAQGTRKFCLLFVWTVSKPAKESKFSIVRSLVILRSSFKPPAPLGRRVQTRYLGPRSMSSQISTAGSYEAIRARSSIVRVRHPGSLRPSSSAGCKVSTTQKATVRRGASVLRCGSTNKEVPAPPVWNGASARAKEHAYSRTRLPTSFSTRRRLSCQA
mmetsp:Transcript_88674/g.156993  ORF Transcript_88674/g.156993 Transcript_88674/m.156993 type:complete len:231 (-) Transcript_88674:531-1223(-)